MTMDLAPQSIPPFNGPVEIGLRALCVLTAAYPAAYSVQHLVVFDYLLVHSDDMPGGPEGLHPQTPFRGGELLVRRGVLQAGLALFESRGLIERAYRDGGIYFSATDAAAGFLDSLSTAYVTGLRQRADWLVEGYGPLEEDELNAMVRERIGTWGAEFTMESVLEEEAGAS
jgi:hypothetical protein